MLPTAAIACSPSCTVDSGAGLPQEQFLSVTMTLDFGLTEGGSAKQIQVAQPFACKMVTLLDEAKVKRAGYRFAGYWTDDGTCVYGPDYKATMVMSPYVEDYTLYARWEIDSSILSITSSGDGASTLDVYGNEAITLRDAVNALVANPLLVGEDGRRRVTFEKLDSTNRVIKLAGEIAIPAGARSFEVNGLCELVPGEKGVELVAGANSRHFNFKGASSDDGGMFSLANLTLTGGKGDNGGSLLLSGANISIDNCAFLGNEASNYGGAICLMAKSTNYLLVASTTFAGNSANHGGALRLQGDGNAAFFVNTTFSGNSASGYGGAVNAINGEEVDFLACTFTGNKAGNATKGPTLSVSTPVNAVNCIFTGNASQFQGDTDKITTYWCSTNAPTAARRLLSLDRAHMRPHLIQFNRCGRILLDGFRIRESPFWMIHLYHSGDCIVRNLDTYAHGHNNDGVDIDMTKRVLVENCRFDQGDDGIVLKAGRNADGWRLDRCTENVVVRDCDLVDCHSLLGIGSELSGGVM